MNTTRTISLVAMITLAITAPPQSFAGDGVIEINQVKALAGGVTPGDAPGFPVTISQSGSYRLTSNLNITAVAAPANTTVIDVDANDVSIDLNGFSIVGSAVCTSGGSSGAFTLTCTGIGSGSGIDGLFSVRVSVRNGTVRGMGGVGVRLDQGGVAENLTVISNGDIGISLFRGKVINSISSSNRGIGISLANLSRVEGCSALNNGAGGITLTFGTVVNSVVSNNVGFGISVSGGCAILGNSIANNNGFGLNASADTGYGQNVFASNNGAGAEVNGGGQIGTNLCNGSPCP